MSQEIYYPQTENPLLEAEELTRSLPPKCDRTILFNIPKYDFVNYMDSVYPYPIAPSYSSSKRDARKSIKLGRWERLRLFVGSAFSDESKAKRQENIARVDSIAESIHSRKMVHYENEQRKVVDLRNDYHERFVAGEGEPVMNYFQYVLNQDAFPLENYDRYQGCPEVIEYLKNERKLSIAYKVPGSDELNSIAHYLYVKKENIIKEVQFPKTELTRYRLNTARYLLLRAALLIKEANSEKVLQSIDIRGFMDVQHAPKTVIRVTVPIRLLESRNPDAFVIDDLFTNTLKAKEAYGLYNIPDYSLTEA